MIYLLSVSVGPVQDFIAAARKCRDLWYGSRLLSEVSKAAARSLRDAGATLIFPAPLDDGDLDLGSSFTVANKLLATMDTDAIEDVVRSVKKAGRDCLLESSRITTLPLRGLEIDGTRYYAQLEAALEFYAAWAPLADYRQTRSRVEYLAAGRKALRDFPDYQGVAGEPKSSLDGVREHVIKGRSKSRLYESNLKSNEWLDAIGIVKRFGKPNARFDSTIDVAAVPYVKGRARKRPEALDRYHRFAARENLPPRTYSPLYPQESRQIFDEDEQAAEFQELKEIREALGEPPTPYYALLLGDGDQMGKAIGKLDSSEDHQRFSRQLSGFAEEARRLVDEDYEGCAIYCGGDDVLALLPLHTALQCAAAINGMFHKYMGKFNVTFSAGMVVAHALEPLSEVRDWAHTAERAAKDAERNSLCVAVHPRSGGAVSVYGKWDKTEAPGLPHLLEAIVDLYARKRLSPGLSHEFRDLIERTRRMPELRDMTPAMAASIARKKEHDEDAAKLVELRVKSFEDLDRLSRAMMAARPFARARKEADDGAEAPHTAA